MPTKPLRKATWWTEISKPERVIVAVAVPLILLEALWEAVRDWQAKRELRKLDVERLRRLWEEGVASGPGRFADISELKAEARRRLDTVQAGKKSSGRR